MLLKFLLIFGVVANAIADDEPRKLYKSDDERLQQVRPFSDPIDGLDYRLPNTTVPIHYNVWLSTSIHLGDFSFDGRVDIRIRAVNNTQEIKLHYRELTIQGVDLMSGTGTVIQTDVSHSFQAELEFLVITPAAALVANQEYVVQVRYEGTLRDDDAGFYRSSYVNSVGVTKWLATTQFESTDARHGFPCYDEPAIRSSYTIQIRHDASYTAISNMPQASRVPEATGNFVLTTFETIPSIQSYLIAFIVSDFTFVEDRSRHVPQRVFATPQSILDGHATLAINDSYKILEAFEKYLGVNYTLPKMDQVAVPDFAAGAMENWGLVTYRDEYLLFNEATGTARNRENVIATISHEFVHQWFGDLVSPAWWSFLWLNEGFATLYENHILSLVYPEERWIDTFLIDTVQPVMTSDAVLTVRPMSYYVENPDRIDRLFDNVAYSKSGSVLKMFQNAFGDSTWAKGLNKYLTARSLDFATPSHLYENVQIAVNEDNPTNRPDVSQVMSSWETQSGFPYINVTRNGNTLTFEQNRFMYADRNSTTLWWVPISYVVGSNPNFTDTKPDLWLQGVRSVSVESASAPKAFAGNDWLVVNIQQSGYYRVNYDSNLWNLIIQQLNRDGDEYNKIHLFNRAQLIDDSFHLAQAGLIKFDVALGIMKYMEKETDYIPWASTNRANTLLNRWLSGTKAYPKYQEFMRKRVTALFDKLGTEIIIGEQRVDRYARSVAINIACQSQLEACLNQTTQKLHALIENGTALAPDLIGSVYCNGIRSANATLFYAIQQKMFRSTSQTERNTLISALGCTQNTMLLTSYLNLAIIPGIPLTLNERASILRSPLNLGENSIKTLLNFVRDNRVAINSIDYLNSICGLIASYITNDELKTEFFAVLELLKGESLISDSNISAHNVTVAALSKLHSEILEDIDEFLNHGTTFMLSSVVFMFSVLMKFFL